MKHRTLLSVLLLLFSLSASAQGERISRQEYIERYKAVAIRQMVEFGIPASITLAQACLESGDGNSTLAIEGNNHFGIKCHGWQGATIHHDDDAAQECFRKYDKVEDSYRDHSEFLRYRDRYAFLFELDPKDYRGWAYGLKKAGYATAPEYAQRLIAIIEGNNLSQYDVVPGETPEIEAIPTPITAEKSVRITPDKGSPLYRISLARQIYSRNGVSYILAEGYDTYETLAKEFRLFRSELLRFNDMRTPLPIVAGQIIYLEKKRTRSAKFLEMHVAEEGETMYDLSQRYAVRLRNLYMYNDMKEGEEPVPGQKIYLQPKKHK